MGTIGGRGKFGVGRRVLSGIITNGLTLYLDAGKTTSYSGAGTTWYDISGNGYNGTLTGGVTYSSANSGSLVFNGSTGYIDLGYKPIINTATTFTLNVWFKTTTTNEQMIFSTIDPNLSKGWHVETLGGKILIQVYPSGTYVVSPKALSANTWNNIAVTYNNGSIIYYSSGVQDGTASYTFTPSSSTIYVGRWGKSPDYWFGGNIATVAFYNRVLSSTEVLQNYNALKGRYI